MKHIRACAIETFESCEKDAILMHQVNCQGVMGSGIAAAIKQKYPEHYIDYMDCCGEEYHPIDLLGDAVYTDLGSGKYITGVFGQTDYGKDFKRYTNYVGLAASISNAFEWFPTESTIIIPKYIGCGLGGGKWAVVEQLLLDIEEVYNVEFVCCEK